MDKRRSEVDVKDGVEEDGMHHHPCHNHLPHLHLADSNAALIASSDVQSHLVHHRCQYHAVLFCSTAVTTTSCFTVSSCSPSLSVSCCFILLYCCHNHILLHSLILFTIAVSIMLFYFALLLSQPHLASQSHLVHHRCQYHAVLFCSTAVTTSSF